MKKLKVPIDINGGEYTRLKENLKRFNENIEKENRLSFDDFVNLVFEVKSLEEKLYYKRDYCDGFNGKIKSLEDELDRKYSLGLSGEETDYKDIVKSRKSILKDSINCIDGTN